MAERAAIREPYGDFEQQREADLMAMAIFLATEIMLFGGLFAAIFIARTLHPQDFVAASKKLHLWIGAANTAVLLTSSLAVAIAARLASGGVARRAPLPLAVAALLGLLFLAIKGVEYRQEFEDGLLPVFTDAPRFANPAEHLFMNLYFIATSLHALHVAIGVGLLVWLVWRMRRAGAAAGKAVRADTIGMFWHLVDAIWVFLYPALYLAR